MECDNRVPLHPPIWLFGANEEQIFYMRILSWNCRGSKWTISYLSKIRHKHKPNFLFFSETKQESDFVQKFQAHFGHDNLVTVDPVGRSGGLALFYNNEY